MIRTIKECALVAAAVAGVLLFAFFMPLGIVAAACQDGLSEAMRSGLGRSGPAPLRIYLALVPQLPLWALAAIVVSVVHVVLRRLLRGSLAFGDSLAWDVVGSPLLTAATAGVATFLKQGSRDGFGANDAVSSAVMAGAFSLVVLALAGLVLGMTLRHPRLRTALAVGLVVLVGVRLGAEAWGRVALARFRAQQAPELLAREARRAAEQRPVLREPGLDEDAWPRYTKLMDAVRAEGRDAPSFDVLSQLADRGPFEPLPREAQAYLDARRATVASLEEATRCRRSAPELSVDPVTPLPSVLAARPLALLLALAGNEQAHGGDLAGAAQRYLDIVRMGGDFGRAHLIHALVGRYIEERGLGSLGRLVHSGRLSSAELETIERDRARLEADRASLARALENETATLISLDVAIDSWQAASGQPLVLPAVVPYRALAARAQAVALPLQRQLAAASSSDDLEAWRRVGREIDAVAGRSWNPLLRLVMGYSGIDDDNAYGERMFLTGRRQLAGFRLVQAAVALELAKRAHGKYPADATGLPADPFAPAQTLRYAPDGASYRLWSIGMDGVDDGGQAEREKDVVL